MKLSPKNLNNNNFQEAFSTVEQNINLRCSSELIVKSHQ